jgi:hypothetical protein
MSLGGVVSPAMPTGVPSQWRGEDPKSVGGPNIIKYQAPQAGS